VTSGGRPLQSGACPYSSTPARLTQTTALSLLVAALGGACGSGSNGETSFASSRPDASGVRRIARRRGRGRCHAPTEAARPLEATGAPRTRRATPHKISISSRARCRRSQSTRGRTRRPSCTARRSATNPIAAGWTVDRGDVGAIGAGPSILGTFQPTGPPAASSTSSAGSTTNSPAASLRPDHGSAERGEPTRAGREPAVAASLSGARTRWRDRRSRRRGARRRGHRPGGARGAREPDGQRTSASALVPLPV